MSLTRRLTVNSGRINIMIYYTSKKTLGIWEGSRKERVQLHGTEDIRKRAKMLVVMSENIFLLCSSLMLCTLSFSTAY